MMQNKIVAVTGGIGSGKSTVCRIIENMGVSVFSCDRIYSDLLSKGLLLPELEIAFGEDIVKDGMLDRALLGKIVFNDEKQLARLNAITHPAIFREAFRKAEGLRLSFLEVPLLFEGGYESLFSDIVVVLRDSNERIRSVAQRDKISVQEAKNRINSQIIYENMNFTEYYVIHNSGNLDELKSKTVDVVNKIMNKMI